MKIYRLPQSDPENFGPKRVRSKKYRKLEKHGQLDLFTSGKILRLQPSSSFEEALVLDESGDTQSAKKWYQKAIQIEDSTADACCNLGIILYEEKDYPSAINNFTLCLGHNPRHCEAHFNLANVYAEVGDLGLAKLHYRIAIEIEPGFLGSYINLGLALAKNDEYEEAIEVLNTFLAQAPEHERQPAEDLVTTLKVMASNSR